LSQAANTFWDDRVERIGAAVRESTVTKRRVRTRRLVDAIILTIVLAAAATCVSVYSRARVELDSALVKHEAAGEKVTDLTIRVQKLERDVKQLRTDSRVIELFARQRFGFIRSGDVVIKVSQDQAESSNGAAESRPVRTANLTPQSSGVYTDASN
jgi:cell division protein FtsB